MDDHTDQTLEQRITHLEQIVADLQETVQQLAGEPSTSANTSAPPPPVRQEAPSAPLVADDVKDSTPTIPAPPVIKKKAEKEGDMYTSEFWLNKVGIGLLLLGLAFLFKYSIDKGWLTPTVRIAFGLILGVGLIAAGQRLAETRRAFSQVMFGGGIATLYITGFAAFQLFEMISHPFAFAFMVGVTILAHGLAVQQNGLALAIIGTLGGLLTPFLLYTGSGNVPGLVVYTCLVVSGSMGIFFIRNWKSLLWISIIGGSIILLIAYFGDMTWSHDGPQIDYWALQLGAIFLWLLFWLVPIYQKYLHRSNPEDWQAFLGNPKSSLNLRQTGEHIHSLAISLPLALLAFSAAIWPLSDETWGWITMVGAALYGLVAWRLNLITHLKEFAATHLFSGLMLFTLALPMLLSGKSLLFAIATEAFILHLVAFRTDIKKIRFSAHFLFICAGLFVLGRLWLDNGVGTAFFNSTALVDSWVILLGALVGFLSISDKTRGIYLVGAHVGFLGLLSRELYGLENGQGYITIAWGIYAVTLLIISLRINNGQVRTLALATLALVVAKLLLVDLERLEAIWRIILFMGFGGAFLLLSYYFQRMWKNE